MFREFCPEACTTKDSVAGSAADVGYTRDSSQRRAQADKGVVGYTRDSSQRHVHANKVVDKRNETWQAPSSVGATSTLPGLPGPGGLLKLGDASEPGRTRERRDISEPRWAPVLGEPGGAHNFVSAPTTLPPVLEARIPHCHRAVSSLSLIHI